MNAYRMNGLLLMTEFLLVLCRGEITVDRCQNGNNVSVSIKSEQQK